MKQLVFIHGPGAGACADAYYYQKQYFPGSLIPTLPGHLEGSRCLDIKAYTEWLRGWLWAHGHNRNLVLVGYTLGASISLQYALDYPEEVSGLVLMTVAARPKTRAPDTYEMRLRAAKDPKVYEDEWIHIQRKAMYLIDPVLTEKLIDQHRKVGPMSQYHDLMTIDAFDVRERISTLKPKLLLLRGMLDHGNPPDYEQEIHEAVIGSTYIRLEDAGHFPIAEKPEAVNNIIENFVNTL
jgi:4,5:9,10-diseco-3-hydroxy-5,9,17-trioxoandrosta-1(10),2-diene-4-oate hydrolase